MIYWKGPVLRRRSPFAQQLNEAREQQHTDGRRLSKVPTGSRANSFARSQQDVNVRRQLGSRQNSHAGTPHRTPMGSRKNSYALAKKTPVQSRRNSLSGPAAKTEAINEKTEG